MHAFRPSVVSLTCLEQFNGEQRGVRVMQQYWATCQWSLPEEIAFLDHLHLFLTREFGQEAGWINAQRYTWYWRYILCKMMSINKLVDKVNVPVGRWQQ